MVRLNAAPTPNTTVVVMGSNAPASTATVDKACSHKQTRVAFIIERRISTLGALDKRT